MDIVERVISSPSPILYNFMYMWYLSQVDIVTQKKYLIISCACSDGPLGTMGSQNISSVKPQQWEIGLYPLSKNYLSGFLTISPFVLGVRTLGLCTATLRALSDDIHRLPEDTLSTF